MYAAQDARREDFRALTTRYRDRLNALYTSTASDADKRDAKAALMRELRVDHAKLKAERWKGFTGYDGWFERANNASFGVLAAYNELVPQFERLYEREGRDVKRFYAEVARLAALPKDQRHATLAAAPNPANPVRPEPVEGPPHPFALRYRRARLSLSKPLQGTRPMPDIKIHRDHSLGLPKARKIALKWAEDVEENFDMALHDHRRRVQRHGALHAQRRQRHADRRRRSL